MGVPGTSVPTACVWRVCVCQSVNMSWPCASAGVCWVGVEAAVNWWLRHGCFAVTYCRCSLVLMCFCSSPSLLSLLPPAFFPFASWAADEWFSKGKLLPLYDCTLLHLPVETAGAAASVLTCTLFCRHSERSRDKRVTFILALACFNQTTSDLQKEKSQFSIRSVILNV